MLRRLADGLIQRVLDYPKLTLSLVLLLVLLAVAGLPRFKLDASADSLTLENDTDLSFYREINKRYGSGDFLVVTFTPSGDLFSDESLDLLQKLQDDLAQIDGVDSINSILTVPLLFSPKRPIRELAGEPLTLRSPEVDRAAARQEFLSSPIYRDLILAPDGRTTGIQLNMAVDEHYIDLVQRRDELRDKRSGPGLSDAEAQELNQVSAEFRQYRTESDAAAHQRVEDVRAVVERYAGEAEIFIGGVSMIAADMITFIQQDLIVFGSAALLFVVVVLAVIFRSVRFVVIPMATCVSAVLIMLGLISWLDWRLTVISSNFVALLLIISLAIIIHLVVRYREYVAENPDWSQRQLVSATLRFMALPCIYTVLTSAVAFMSLVVSDIGPVIDFGWMMTIGLLFALLLAFVLMPACLMLLKPERLRDAGAADATSNKPLTLYCSAVVERHGGWVLGVAGVAAALSFWGITRLEVENRFVDYFHEDTEIYQGLWVIDNQLGGTTSLDIVINMQSLPAMTEDPEPSAITPDDEEDPFGEFATAEEDPFAEADRFNEEDPFAEGAGFAEDDPFAESGADPQSQTGSGFWMTVAGLQTIEAVHDYLDEQPEVGKVQSLATLYKVGKVLNGSLNNFELAIMEQSLPQNIREVLIDPYYSRGDETRITMRVIDTYPGLKRVELVERIRSDLATKLGLDTEHVRLSGLLVLYNNMLQSLFSSQILTLGAVFLGIMLMFVVLFRSLLIAIVAIVPNMLAAFVILGGMGLYGIPLDMMTITIAAITVGVGVDHAIHYIYRFRTEIAKDGDYVAAMHRSHGSIGKAMYYTSIIIIFGFSIMVLSRFIPTIYFGVLTAFAMLAALLGSLFLLPRLILLSKPFKLKEDVK